MIMSWDDINEDLGNLNMMRAQQEAARSADRAANELAAMRAEQAREMALPQCPYCGGRIQPNFSLCQHCRNELGWVRGVACIPGTEQEVLALFIAEDKRQALEDAKNFVKFRESRLRGWWIATLFLLLPLDLLAITGLLVSNDSGRAGWLVFCGAITIGLLFYIVGWINAVSILKDAKRAFTKLTKDSKNESIPHRNLQMNPPDIGTMHDNRTFADYQDGRSTDIRLVEGATKKCWIKRGSQVKGPLEIQKIVEMIAKGGSLEIDDRFASSPNGPWITYQELIDKTKLQTTSAGSMKPIEHAKQINCPRCSKALRLSDSNVGKILKCHKCDTKFNPK
jgi:hypothetical protein